MVPGFELRTSAGKDMLQSFELSSSIKFYFKNFFCCCPWQCSVFSWHCSGITSGDALGTMCGGGNRIGLAGHV